MTLSIDQAERRAVGVGVLTSAAGIALLLAPERTGRSIGVRADPGMRIVGVVDLVIGAGLISGRPRWPWLAARAMCNPPTVAYFAALGRRHEAKVALVLAAAILIATADDIRVTRVLKAAGR